MEIVTDASKISVGSVTPLTRQFVRNAQQETVQLTAYASHVRKIAETVTLLQTNVLRARKDSSSMPLPRDAYHAYLDVFNALLTRFKLVLHAKKGPTLIRTKYANSVARTVFNAQTRHHALSPEMVWSSLVSQSLNADPAAENATLPTLNYAHNVKKASRYQEPNASNAPNPVVRPAATQASTYAQVVSKTEFSKTAVVSNVTETVSNVHRRRHAPLVLEVSFSMAQLVSMPRLFVRLVASNVV